MHVSQTINGQLETNLEVGEMLIKVGEKGDRKGRQTFLTVIAHGNHTVTSFNIAKLEEKEDQGYPPSRLP